MIPFAATLGKQVNSTVWKLSFCVQDTHRLPATVRPLLESFRRSTKSNITVNMPSSSSTLPMTTATAPINSGNNNNIPVDGNGSGKPDLSFCILWSPLPPITWILPFIGHTGICDSRGITSDFQGSYYVADFALDGQMAFGKATRYLKIDVSQLPGGIERWDEAIREANSVYCQRIHNICCDNCHR